MKSNKLIVFGACLFLFFTSFASVTYGVKIDQEIALETIQTGFNAANTDETTVEITVNLEDFNFNSKNTEQGLFTSINLPDFSYSYIQGLPKLPVIRKTIEIPFDSDLQISINTISWEETNLDDLSMPNRIIPAQHSVEKIPEPIDDFIINEEFYNANMFYPQNIAEVVDTGIVRGRCFAQIEISPVQYNPANGDLKLMNACEITIDLQNADMARTYDELQKYSTPSYENLFSKMFENYGFYEQELLGGRDDEGFLAIVYDDFYDELQPLTNLKESKGYDVTVTKTSDIPGGPSKENIFDYIQEAYDDWSIPPAYILLVGDTPQIPTFDGETYGPSAADLYFVTVDGSDWIPDIHIGRFSGSSEAHIQAMVEKTVLYENADFDDTEWIKKAAFIASSDHGQLAEETHNHVIDTYLDSAGYSCDKIYEASGGNTQDIYDSLNDGRSLCIYSGHGYSGGWGCVPFSSNDIYNLENEDMYPFVCSHACSTNVFDQSECYGEAWLRAEDKGAIGFWGASASTYWDEDDILEKRMFQAWWDDDLSTIGGMTDMALLSLYDYYGGGSVVEYYFECYNVLGDPSLSLVDTGPMIDLGELTGGFGLSCEISNTGLEDAINVEWSMILDGFVLLGKKTTGTEPMIGVDESVVVSSDFLLGLGPIDITVSAGDQQKTAHAFLLGPFVVNLQ